jgi:hypothetical protein
MPVPPAQADINSVGAINRASKSSAARFFLPCIDPVSSIPKTPSPENHIAKTGCCRVGRMAAEEDAAVRIVTVAATVLDPGVTELGEILQAEFAGAPLQVSVTALPKVPPTEATFTV